MLRRLDDSLPIASTSRLWVRAVLGSPRARADVASFTDRPTAGLEALDLSLIGLAAGLTVRIARAGSSQPAMMYGFRDEAPTQPQCTVRAPATLSCKHESGLTTTYTQSGDSTLDFTAQGPKEGDEVLRAQLSRMREP